jgi:hypothetical protein
MRRPLTMPPSRANSNKRRHQYWHRRDPDDNESAICGSTDGAAALHVSEVNCPHPRCRFEVSS